MSQDILITPGSGEPQILFRGSGTTDTAVELNVLSSYQSATGSGTALLFEGEEGLLFGVTDNLSSGTIFSVSDISGLTAIEYDASGDLKLGEYANSTTLYSDRGVYLASGIPTNTTNAVYISGGALHFNGSTVGGYDDAAISGYFESRVDQADSDIATVSGLLYDDAAISGYFESRVEQNAADIVTVSGLAGGSSYTAGSGLTLVGTEFNTAGTGNFNEIRFSDSNNSVLISADTNIPTYSNNSVTIGLSAGDSASGEYNTQIGNYAGQNINGDYNTFIGTFAGNKSSSTEIRNYSTAVGYRALTQGIYTVEAADYFSVLGAYAGYAASGNRSVGIGYKSLYIALGDDNIEIVNDGTNSPLSYNNNGNLLSQNNKLHIGYTILGDTSDKKLAIGNVSFSNIDPDATLEILPNAATDVGLIVQAATSHSASLQEWQNSSETKLLAVGPDGGLELPNNVPSTTTNKLYNNAGTLTFNGSALGGGGISNIVEDTTPQLGGTLDANGNTIDMGTYVITDTKVGQWDTAYGWGDHGSAGYLTTHPTISAASSSNNSGRTYIQDITLDSNGHVTGLATATETVTDTTYTAGSGLTLVGTEFNVYGGSGNFQQIDVTSDNTFTPKMVFTGSGVTDTPIRMKVLSSHASASTSGTALAFEGTEGQLFGITDNLSSGTIFSVNDITGLPLISANASGDVKLAEFGRDLIAHKPITIESGVPSTTTNKLYNDGYKLNFDGATLPKSDPVAGASGIHNMMVMSQATYDALGTKDPNTLYYIV